MKTNCLLRIFVFLFLMAITTSCYPARYDGPYKGKIVEAETGNPIEGVVVLGVWYKEIATAAGGVSSYYDAAETVTTKNGEFEIKGKGLKIMSNVGPMHVLIFKSGYQYIDGPWASFKVDEGLLKKKVAWEGNRAIIPLTKLTMEERKKQGSPNFPSEGYKAKKIPLLIKELNKEEKYFGRSSYPEE